MRFLDLMGHVADVSALPIAVAGFGITLWQIKRTRKVAEAARDSAVAAQSAIQRSNLLVLIPQLLEIEAKLERAAKDGMEEVITSNLRAWRWQAGQVKGLLEKAGGAAPTLLTALQDSIAAAAQLQTELVGVTAVDWPAATLDVRGAIAGVTNELGALSAARSTETGGVLSD
ncbi:hypothetical protein [Micromonospora aurantiaca (nom. illeg.)]|uniref:hypothetical protein n=1 Tax=Micromonospora aurantiaca (nom. illeg.) TaxID=47850 RepID=UPI003EBFE316